MNILPGGSKEILDILPDLLFLIDREQRVLWCNRQAADMFDSPAEPYLPLAKVTGMRKIGQLAAQVLESRLPLEFSYEDTTIEIKTGTALFF